MKISIITVCFNAASTIQDTIDSVANQIYKDIEYIVIDGGSNDGTIDVIKKNSSKINVWVSEPDCGLYDAMNKGLKIASGEIVGFINADDILNSDTTLLDIAEKFNASKVDILYGDLVYCSFNNLENITRVWISGECSTKKFRRGWMPPHLSTYIKLSAYKMYGSYRTDMLIAADYELMLRLMVKHNLPHTYLPKVLARMRQGGLSNSSLRNILLSNIEAYKSWKMNNLSVSPAIILLKPLRKLFQINLTYLQTKR